MKQIICDICKKPIEGRYSKLNLPYMFGGDVMQNHKFDDDEAYDVCKKCALDLYDLIEKFKMEKRNTK